MKKTIFKAEFLLTAATMMVTVALFQNCGQGFQSASTASLSAQSSSSSSSGSETPSTGSGNSQTSGSSQGSGPVSTASVVISWSAPSDNQQTNYSLEQSIDGTTFAQVQVLGATATSATVGSLRSGITYYFRIRAYNTSGYSAYAPTQTASIP